MIIWAGGNFRWALALFDREDIPETKQAITTYIIRTGILMGSPPLQWLIIATLNIALGRTRSQNTLCPKPLTSQRLCGSNFFHF
jgi:hypothetical protein